MASDFDLVWKQIESDTPGLPGTKAQQLTQQAWEDLRNAKYWSWLRGSGVVQIPVIISAGSVTVVLGSDQVVADAAAATAWNAIGLSNPPLAGVVGVGRQIRVGSGPYYSLISWDSATTATLDRPYAEPSGAAQPYGVFKAYYLPPESDFLRYETILNAPQGYWISGQRLTKDQTWLNAVDPQRGSSGDPYWVCGYLCDPLGVPIHEWWPQPQNPYGMLCFYRKKGGDLTRGDNLPATLGRQTLVARAQVLAADWAMRNVGRFRELSGANWGAVRAQAQAEWDRERRQAVIRDRDVSLDGIIRKAVEAGFPLDGSWLQSHDPWMPLG